MPSIPEHFIPEFTAGIEFQTQQKISRLKEYCTDKGTSVGEIRFLNQLEPSEAHETTGQRGQATKRDQLYMDRRCMTPREITKAVWLARNDNIFLGGSAISNSDALQTITMAHNRKIDQYIIESAYGVNFKGAKGNEPVNIPESQKLPITTGGGSQAVSLNLEKLLCIRQILEENESLSDDCMNSGDKLVMMVNSSMLKALLQEEKLTSSDYQAVQALVNGTINEALGIRFVRTELLLKDANGNPQALAYMKSGLAFSTWKGLEVKVDELMEQNYDYQIWAQQNFGATRMDEKKFVIVPCKYMPAI